MKNNIKKFSLITIVSLLIVISGNATEKHETVMLSIANMTCKMCNITVRKSIEKVDGVKEAKVDFESKTAEVLFDPEKTSIEIIKQASTMSGYPATLKTERVHAN